MLVLASTVDRPLASAPELGRQVFQTSRLSAPTCARLEDSESFPPGIVPRGSAAHPPPLEPSLPTMSRIGRNTLITTPPTITPMTVIRIGSIMLVSDFTAALTCAS